MISIAVSEYPSLSVKQVILGTGQNGISSGRVSVGQAGVSLSPQYFTGISAQLGWIMSDWL